MPNRAVGFAATTNTQCQLLATSFVRVADLTSKR
jgi:hypothetical protein